MTRGRPTHPRRLPLFLSPTNRSIPNFRDVYNYIRDRLEDDARDNTPALPSA